jgi:uncharacterized protein (UPF0305 family)
MLRVIKGKHKELLVELLIHYLTKRTIDIRQKMVNDIKAQNEDGQWYTNYYLNNYNNEYE